MNRKNVVYMTHLIVDTVNPRIMMYHHVTCKPNQFNQKIHRREEKMARLNTFVGIFKSEQ